VIKKYKNYQEVILYSLILPKKTLRAALKDVIYSFVVPKNKHFKKMSSMAFKKQKHEQN
jgi:hypothetical protein